MRLREADFSLFISVPWRRVVLVVSRVDAKAARNAKITSPVTTHEGLGFS